MELKAKLIQLLPLQTGEGKNGPWKKQDIILETDGKFPKKVCVAIWGDKIDSAKLQVGNLLNVSFDVESREYNSKWYTDIKAWKVEVDGSAPSSPASAPSDYTDIPPPSEVKDDLPF